ncbi:MoxR family ATPase [Oceanispirochaeta crateris]|jgi:MoxR-like ATPase|uniref:MoxR family ATPase n=1 Tax=Oceanispirochaeta crateris TaxID=2518645 RepID=A0A5C1QQK3_9SPIO|nr:MoxR family ATPase [Oceanispirochaeta crateris]QEN08894.1 MoxR family ATPase [Oceanispirochaeta crateris]
MSENKNLTDKMKDASMLLDIARKEIAKRIIGQADMVNGLLMGIITGGHILVEGVPGLAKTQMVKAVADVLNADFKRIQFTPDLLPADLTGTMIYRPQTGEFVPRKGPVFSNIILADEINRAPSKVQAALLEAMAESQVTIGDNTYRLAEPFFVMATQNPIEQEGTYQLPEAQLDRFIMKLKVDYPNPQEELAILNQLDKRDDQVLRKVFTKYSIQDLKDLAASIRVDESIKKYIVSIVNASRVKGRNQLPFTRFIEFGASPRASIALFECARVNALFENREFVLPEDVKAVAYNVLRHRIVLSYEAESEELSSDDVIRDILSIVTVP